ncbi:MAG: hypothetical protein R6V12_16550 [Candidatus Hydrogenedentota bacterium]
MPDRSLEGLPVHWYGAPEAVRYGGGHGKSDALITNKFIMGLVENRELFIDLWISPALTCPIEKLRMLLQKGDR